MIPVPTPERVATPGPGDDPRPDARQPAAGGALRAHPAIDEALGALYHVGPRREALLRAAGRRRWGDLVASCESPAGIPRGRWDAIRRDAAKALLLLERCDWGGLCRKLPSREHWRILAATCGRLTYVDIETDGLEAGAGITTIACLHRGRLLCFNRTDGLDGFLDLLDTVDVLASFNGSGFDVPRLLRWFHIPELPCAHLDLRWISHHAGLRGGLKHIERTLELRRPADLAGVDGALAPRLWALWENGGHAGALRQLVRYCAADTVMLPLLAQRLLALRGCDGSAPDEASALWALIPPAPDDGAEALQRAQAAGDLEDSPVGGVESAAARDERRARLGRQWRRLQSAARRTDWITTGV